MKTLSQSRLAVSHRVQRALAQAGLTQVEAARQAEVERGAVHKAVQRGSIPRDKDTRDKIAGVLHVDPFYLWYERDEQAEQQPPASQKSSSAPARAEPVASEARSHQPPLPLDPEGYVAIVREDAWRPIAMPNDCLWVTPSYKPEPNDRVLVKSEKHGQMLAILMSVSGDHYSVMTTFGGTRTLPAHEVEAIHKVSGLVSN